jgi:hypothetical protein
VSLSSSFSPYGHFKRPMAEPLLPEISFNCDHGKVCYVVQFFLVCVLCNEVFSVLRLRWQDDN